MTMTFRTARTYACASTYVCIFMYMCAIILEHRIITIVVVVAVLAYRIAYVTFEWLNRWNCYLLVVVEETRCQLRWKHCFCAKRIQIYTPTHTHVHIYSQVSAVVLRALSYSTGRSSKTAQQEEHPQQRKQQKAKNNVCESSANALLELLWFMTIEHCGHKPRNGSGSSHCVRLLNARYQLRAL